MRRPPLPACHTANGVASLACAPLRDPHGYVVGVLQAMGSESSPLKITHLETLTILAHMLSCSLAVLKAGGQQTAEQVQMQRANADLQRESRQPKRCDP